MNLPKINMSGEVKVIKQNKVLGGYTLSVRDDWVYKLKKIHLNEREKNKYLEEFGGEEIITFETFFQWYKQVKKGRPEDNTPSK